MADVPGPGGAELRRLRDVIVAHYTRARFEVELGHLDQNLETISVDRDMPTIVGRVLFEARRGGWLPQLLEWAAREPYPQVAAVAGELLTGVEPWSRTCLDGNDPFLGRPGLRAMLRTAIPSGDSPVLAVTGPPGSGRSYTARFVEHVAAALGGYRTAVTDVGDVLADSAAVVRRIRSRLSLPEPEPPPAGDSRPPIDRLADDLDTGSRLILMLDGLDGAGPSAAPVLLAERLHGKPVSGLTLVLLGCDPGLPGVSVEHLLPITVAQVADHLAEVAQRAGVVLEPGVAGEFAAWVLRGQPTTRAVGVRVRRLGQALRERAVS